MPGLLARLRLCNRTMPRSISRVSGTPSITESPRHITPAGTSCHKGPSTMGKKGSGKQLWLADISAQLLFLQFKHAICLS